MKKSAVINNPENAKKLVTAAMKCDYPVWVISGDSQINAKSIIGVFSVGFNDKVIISAESDSCGVFFDEIRGIISE